MSGRLLIVCGLPGAGKTTRALVMERELGAVRFSADDWMIRIGVDLFDGAARDAIEGIQRTLAERLIRLGATVVVEWGTWSRRERDQLRAMARDAGAAAELHALEAPVDVLWERVEARGLEQRHGSRALTQEDIAAAAAAYEAPDAEEFALYDAPGFATTTGRA